MRNSMMKTAYLGVMVGAVLAVSVPASAQYVGPTEKVTAVTVAEVLEKSKDDDRVSLRGRLVRQVSDEHYMFADATGEIQVEIDDKVFPKVPVDDKTDVAISGEVDKGLVGEVEIDVKAVQLLK